MMPRLVPVVGRRQVVRCLVLPGPVRPVLMPVLRGLPLALVVLVVLGTWLVAVVVTGMRAVAVAVPVPRLPMAPRLVVVVAQAGHCPAHSQTSSSGHRDPETAA